VKKIFISGEIIIRRNLVIIDIAIGGASNISVVQFKTTRKAWKKDFYSLLNKAEKGAI
jgi:hypothetical protein